MTEAAILNILQQHRALAAQRLLVIESSTERLSVALGQTRPDQVWSVPAWQEDRAGGALASQHLLPMIQGFMRAAAWTYRDLDAIVFGAGPGAFTGLRTACAVAQGLGFAHNIPLLGVPSVLAMAWDAWSQHLQQAQHNKTTAKSSVLAMLDARMQEWYVCAVDFAQPAFWQAPISLVGQAQLATWQAEQNADDDVIAVTGRTCPPRAQAMWQLAPYMLAAGLAVEAAAAAPVYVRNRVAQTTAERRAAREAEITKIQAQS